MTETLTLERVFGDLPVDVRKRLAAAAIEKRFAEGQSLFRAGDPADGLYVVLSGRVRVSRVTTHHVELLHYEDAGGILGELPVFGGGPFPATAIATERSLCAKIPKDAIDLLLNESPDFGAFAVRRLARRAQTFLKRIDELTAVSIAARVAAFIQERAQTGWEFGLGRSQAELAEEMGTAREVVVRAIADLVRSGAIKRSGRSRFVVVDHERLAEAAVSGS